MKKSLMILPPFLLGIYTYGTMPEVRAATDETTALVQNIESDVTLDEAATEIIPPEVVTPVPDTSNIEIPAAIPPPPDLPLVETTIPPETVNTETILSESTTTDMITSETQVSIPASSEATLIEPTIPPEAVTSETFLSEPNPITETITTDETSPETLTVEVHIPEGSVDEIFSDGATADTLTEATLMADADTIVPATLETATVTNYVYETDTTGPSQYINSVNIDENIVALTFDDGNSATNLYDILWNLNELDVKATFFVNGTTDPDLMRQIVADGHQLANHTYSHNESTTISANALANDITIMENYIQDTTGTSSLPFFRAPYGDYNSSVLNTVGSLGYQYTIGWSIDTLDWTGIADTAVSDSIMADVHPGAIVLMHASVGAANTPESLWYSIAALRSSGYSFARVDELLSLGGYYEAEQIIETPVDEISVDAPRSTKINQVNTGDKTISLTISDASDATNVRQILANLADTDVKATFFLNGLTDPDIIGEIIAQGHEIGNHTYTQDDATNLSIAEIEWELITMEEMVQNNSGVTSRPYFRAPMGETTDTILAVAAGLGYDYTIGWTVDTRDWTGTLTAAEISETVVNTLAPGSIYLLHGNATAATTPEALRQMIAAVRAEGYKFATISNLLSLEGYYPEEPVVEIPVVNEVSKLVNHVNTNQQVVSLTISGVSDDEQIDAILQNLGTLGVKATFFIDGSTSQSALDNIVAAGHEVGNQAYSGNLVTGMTAEQLAAEVALTEGAVVNAGGSSKPYFRAPGGLSNTSVLETVGSLGYGYTIGWSIDPWDWSGIPSSEITSIVTSQLAPGAIILLDAGSTAIGTPAALSEIIAKARTLGYDFATISSLLALEGYYPDIPIIDIPDNIEASKLVNYVNTGQQVVSLTISGVSDEGQIDAILQNLGTSGVKATFFINGSTSQSALDKIVAAGHEIGNQANSSSIVTGITAEQLAAEVVLTEDAVINAGGSSKPYFRAPGGLSNATVLETVGSLGYGYTIGWSIDPWDWSGNSASEITSIVTSQLTPGAIILLDAGSTATGTPAALLDIIAQARALGYDFATISSLLAWEGYYPEEPILTGPSQLFNQVNTDQKVISLTISGVSDDTRIDDILQNLASLDVKATFFIEGSTSQAALNKIVASGHEIGNQANSGADASGMTADQLKAEIILTEASAITAGSTSKPYFRAPAGVTNDSILNTAGSLGYDYTIGWSIDPRDWSGNSASDITSIITSQLAPGAIILMDAGTSATGTAAALISTIEQAWALGYDFTTISGLLTWEGIYTGVVPEEPIEEEIGPSRYVERVDTGANVLALTFDDGNDYGNLYDIIYNLNSLGVKATFFVNGWTDPELMKFIVDSGHQLSNHTYSHNDYSTALSPEDLAYDIDLMEDYTLQTTGVSSKPYFRAPAGIWDDSVLETVGSLGYRYTIGWTQDTRDWEGMSDVEVAASVTDYLDAGSIYLLHANPTAVGTPESLWYIVAEARSQGYEFVTIDQLMALEGVYDDISVGEDTNGSASQFIEQINTDQQVVSLTFDDLGDTEVLQQILDNLAELNVKATFFADASADPNMLYQIVAQGHELGNHTYSHEFSTYLTIEEFTNDLNAMDSIIQDATGVSSRPLFRPPYGDYDASVLETAGSLGYDYTIGWSADSLDWVGTYSPSEIAENVLNNLIPGAIFLMHAVPESANTPASLFEIVTEARALGYEFTTVGALLGLSSNSGEDPATETPIVVVEEEFTIPELEQFADGTNPIITRGDVTDFAYAFGAADPFIVYDGETYHMFFEVLGEYNIASQSFTDKVAHAYSNDLVNWTYTQIVLSQETDGTRAAYPNVFEYQDSYYMVPDLAGNIETFVATDFPLEWDYHSTLMEGNFVDTNIFEVGDIWYMTTSENPYNSIGLYYNTSGDWRNDQWVMHPAGLIIEEDLTEKGYRGAGNPFVYEDYVVMPVQTTPVATGVYGQYTSWYKLSDLSTTTATVEYLGEAVGSQNDGGWATLAMHHISHAPYGDGYIYAVDGLANYAIGTGTEEYTIGLYTEKS